MKDDTSLDATSGTALPDSWISATVESIAIITSGQTPKGVTEVVSQGEFPWFRVGDMNSHGNETYLKAAKVNLSKQDVEALRIRLRPPGTIVFPKRGGAIATNKKRILAQRSAYDLNTMGIYAIGLDHSYFWHWFMTIDLGNLSDGSNVPQINNDDIQPLNVPLPPRNEQRRIVEKIEELFTKLDAGVRSLEQARALLKSYRRSVLKAAVEGELSREWREAHRDTLEPTSELLERILQERREKFAGKKYKEPDAPDTLKLPTLPNGWEWATTNQLFGFVTSGSRDWKKYYSNKGAIFIRTQDINKDRILLEDVSYVDLPPRAEGKRSRVLENDILIIITGANVGKVALVDRPLPEAYVSQSVALTRPVVGEVAEFLHLAMIAEGFGRSQLDKLAYGMGRPVLNLTNVQQLILPLPSLAEQEIITSEYQRRISIIDELDDAVEASLRRADGLRQSILKRAFSGKLVPQDPDDESASMLLERIRLEREAAKPKPRKGRKSNARPTKSGHTDQGGLF